MDFHPDDNSIIVLSANDDGQGLNFISADTGRSWIAMPNLPNNLLIYDIASDIDYPDTFYAGTDSGLFKLENFVKSGTIASNETWGPGLVVINGDVTVNSGVKLTIAAGTEVQVVYDFDKDQSGASSSKSELIVKGILAAKGTSNDPIVFKSSKPSSPGAGDWFAIRADSGSYDTLEYCTIQHADYAVKAYKPSGLSVQHCYLNDISTAGIYMQYPPTTARVRYSKLETCGTYGLYCANNYFTATSDTILETRYGIYFQGNGNPTFEDCYMTYPHPFLYLSYYGIYAVGSSAPASATPTVSGCFIRGFDQGGIYLELVDGQGTVSETRIDTCATYGIYLKNSDAGILGGSGSYNRAAGNTYGLYVSSSSSPTVRRTKFWENVSYGIYVTSGCSGDFGQNNANQQGQNSFHTGSGIYYWDFYNAGGTDLDAYYNFWGESRPNSSQIVGAKYDPYLSSDPLPAKISPNDMVGLPEDFSLATVYPNPFNPTTVLKVNLAAPQRVTVKIFNIVGQEVIMLYDGTMNSGEHELVWDGRNSRGEMASTGVYLFSVQSPESRKTLKATLLK
jgi:hypothetical protein